MIVDFNIELFVDKAQFDILFEELENQIGKDDIDLSSIKLEKIRMEKQNEKNK